MDAQSISELATVSGLEECFGRIDQHLRDARGRESFGTYAGAILGDGEHKSAETIAARACADTAEARLRKTGRASREATAEVGLS